MDTNFLGIPKEPFGFSNNAKGGWSRASMPPFRWGDTEITIAL